MPATPEFWAPSIMVNSILSGTQSDQHIIQLSNGYILVAWTSTEDTGAGSPAGTDIIGQLFNPLGLPDGNEFRLNVNFIADDERNFDIAATADGGFVAVYEDDPGPNDQIAIRAVEWQVDSSGAPIIASVGTTIATSADAGDVVREPTVTASADGSYVVGYEFIDSSSGSHSLRFKPVSATGVVGAEDVAIAGSALQSPDIDSAMLSNGDTVFVNDFSGSESAIAFSVRSPGGTSPTGAQYVADTGTNGQAEAESSVAALTGGGFVIAWTETDSNDTDVFFQRYSNAGLTQGGPMVIANEGASDLKNEPEVVALSDGGFVIFYDDDQPGQTALRGQRYDALGDTVGMEFVVTSMNATSIEASLLGDGRLAVTWIEDEINMAIFDTRDNANDPEVYSPNSWMIGTVGNDVFTVDPDTSIAYGWDGDDAITGSSGADRIFGGTGDDVIAGGPGSDAVIGGVGNDQFRFYNGQNSDNVLGGLGVDWFDAGAVSLSGLSMSLLALNYTLYGPVTSIVNVENVSATQLSDTVIGSHAANVIFGNGGNDVVHGRGGNDDLYGGAGSDDLVGGSGLDLLDGGFGTDTMQGGAHADIYVMDDVGDVIDESLTGSSGFDVVRSSVSANLATASFLGAIEGVTLTGNADINALGNVMANLLTGNGGDNVLNGRANADNMRGLGGSDIYVFDNAGDMADESIASSSGNDWIVSSVTVNLGNPAQVKGAIEAVTLTGGANANVFGNLLVNNISGNAGNNIINGRAGSDQLTGGGGSDAFYFSSAPGVANIDDVNDFAHGTDRLWLDDAVFSSLGAGPLGAGNFHVFTPGDPVDANDYILYSQAAGTLYYDADGSGAGMAQPFAHMGAGTVLTASDFLVV